MFVMAIVSTLAVIILFRLGIKKIVISNFRIH